MHHRRRRRRRRVTERRPRVERPHRRKEPEPEQQTRERSHLRVRGHPDVALQLLDVHCPGRVIDHQQPDQRQHRARRQVQRQLHRRVLFRAPVLARRQRPVHADQQIHRDHRQLVEEVEEKQIHRAERPADPRRQREEQDVILLLPVVDFAGDQRAGKRHEPDQQQQRHRNPVHAELQIDAPASATTRLRARTDTRSASGRTARRCTASAAATRPWQKSPTPESPPASSPETETPETPPPAEGGRRWVSNVSIITELVEQLLRATLLAVRHRYSSLSSCAT